MNKRQTGSEWERKAVEYLAQNGYTIIQTNYRCKIGEIDIIAKESDTLCFIEVKYRSDKRYGNAIEAVTPSKQNTIRKTALHYLVTVMHSDNIDCRFDVIGFDGGEITIIKNAF